MIIKALFNNRVENCSEEYDSIEVKTDFNDPDKSKSTDTFIDAQVDMIIPQQLIRNVNTNNINDKQQQHSYPYLGSIIIQMNFF